MNSLTSTSQESQIQLIVVSCHSFDLILVIIGLNIALIINNVVYLYFLSLLFLFSIAEGIRYPD